MKLLARNRKGHGKYTLIHLADDAILKKLRVLISKGKYAQAISAALSSGRSLKEIPEGEINSTDVGLILTSTSAHWDIT